MTFFSLSLVSLFASLVFLTQPIPGEALINDVGRLPGLYTNCLPSTALLNDYT